MRVLIAALALILAMSLLGCRSTGAGAKPPAVSIVAYINVSSGCQEPTVSLLQQLVEEHKGKVQLDLVDFGDGADGARRWQESGHTCMTIELNGSPYVKFPTPEGDKTVTFQLPEGFMWTHDELVAAVEAGLEGKLQTITEEEAAAAEPARQVRVSTATKGPQKPGMPAQVLLNDRPVIEFYDKLDGKSPAKRAEAALLALRTWLHAPVRPTDLSTRETAAGWEVRALDKLVAVATPGDAKGAKTTPEKLAKAWALAIRHVVLNSAAVGDG